MEKAMKYSLPRRQRGMTLFVGLVMLILLFLMAITAFNLSRTNTAVTGNMQHRMEAVNAAMQATEQVISTTQFIATPNDAVPGTCGTNRICLDVNGDGTSDITVALQPPCIKKIEVIQNLNLNPAIPADLDCSLGIKQDDWGVEGAVTGNSRCANSVWEIVANASDTVTQARATVVTGVAVRVSANEALDTSKACL
jgi:Tfp pilus assembly protein PilX